MFLHTRSGQTMKVVPGFAGLLLLACGTVTAQPPVALRLDVTSLHEPTAIWTTLSSEGTVRQVRYLPNRMTVVAITQKRVDGTKVKTLFEAGREAVRNEQQKAPGKPALTPVEDDTFWLGVDGPGAPKSPLIGPIAAAAPPIQAFLQSLNQLAEKGKNQTLAYGYLRGEVVAADRMQRIQQDGSIPFLPLEKAPPEVRSQLEEAMHHPRDFVALTKAQTEQLKSLCATGAEFYLTDKQVGYQCRLFSTEMSR